MMSQDEIKGGSLPPSTRRYRFTLIPMADVMFQLLIFFMLSANMTPYSLLAIRSGTLSGPSSPDVTRPGAADDIRRSNPMTTAVWSFGADSIVANGQRFALNRIPELAEALKQQATPEVLLISRPGATVQTLVSILEILADQGIATVHVANGGGI